MTATQTNAIERHGLQLLAIFPNATDKDPVSLCRKLRRLEGQAAAVGLRLCNGPEYAEGQADALTDGILRKANALLGNVNEYQPKTGAKCGCKRGIQRDNCPACEGTGFVIDFRAIRQRRQLVPVFINRDPRGHALKIDDTYMREHSLHLVTDWGGYGILAPEINE